MMPPANDDRPFPDHVPPSPHADSPRNGMDESRWPQESPHVPGFGEKGTPPQMPAQRASESGKPLFDDLHNDSNQ